MQCIKLIDWRFHRNASFTALFVLMALLGRGDLFAQSVKVGRTVGGSGFHIPSYVAIDKGLLLDSRYRDGVPATSISQFQTMTDQRATPRQINKQVKRYEPRDRACSRGSI